MKKIFVYGFLVAAAIFAAVMAWLLLKSRADESALGTAGSRVETAVISPAVKSKGKAVSGKNGKVILVYTGDIVGSLDPCG